MMLPAAKDNASSSVPSIPQPAAKHEEGQFDDCDDEHAAAVKTPPQLNQSKEQCAASNPSRDDLSSRSDQTAGASVAESREDKDESSDGQHQQQISARGITKADVLSGRGGGTNNHAGNRHFRTLCDQSRHVYVMSKKMQKREIAKEIVAEIRACGGRFLKRDDKTGEWEDIGEAKAVSKTSQALREGLAQKMRQALVSSGTAERMRLEANSGGAPSHAAAEHAAQHAWSTASTTGRDHHPHVGSAGMSPYIETDHGYHQHASVRMVSPDDRARTMPFSDHGAPIKRQRFGF